MSEPSPEAKQAAEKIYHPDAKHLIHAFVQGYDTATAKLRGELEQMKQYALKLDNWNDDLQGQVVHQQPTATDARYHHLQIDYDKLWDEASRLRNALVCIATDDYPEEFVARATEADSARMFAQEQLVHQQPSDECKIVGPSSRMCERGTKSCEARH